jgi:hypothetical protein
MTAGPDVDGIDCIIVDGFSMEWYGLDWIFVGKVSESINTNSN